MLIQKIDIEGFEYSCIKGLKQPNSFISFEFTKELFEETKKCINYLMTLGNPVFNLSIGESGVLLFKNWVKNEGIIKYVSVSSYRILWGDVYAQFLSFFLYVSIKKRGVK